MNYILNETTPQFFLDEKFDLCERFILKEAETTTDTTKKPETVKEWAIETKDTLSRAYKALEGNNDKANDSKEADLNKIFNYIASLKNLINQNLDPSKLKPKVIEFIEKFKTLLASVAGTENNFDWPKLKAYLGVSPAVIDFVSTLEKTVDMAKNNSYTKETINELRTQVNTIYDLSKKFIAEYSAKDTTEESKLIDINKFKDACTKFILCCDVIEKLDEKYTNGVHKDFIEIASWIRTDIKWLVDKKETSPNWAKDTQYKTTFSELIKRMAEFNNKWLKDIQQLAKSYDINTDDATKAVDTKDWDKTYKDWPKDNKSQEEFWNLYYKNVWGSDAQKVAYLGEAFRQELTSWGFTENHNPFITFVKKYLIDKKYNITGEHYEKLHNAVVYGKVPRNLLKCTTEKHRNIIFNRAAYAGSANDFEEYLDAQYTIAGTTGNANIDPLREILFSMNLTAETANSSTGHIGIIAAIMFGNADTPSQTMKNFKVSDWNDADWEELKINSVKTVKALLNDYIGGEVANKVKIASLSQLGNAGRELAKAAIDNTSDGIIRLAKMYSFLIRLWAPDKIDDLLNKYKLRADSKQNVQDAISRNNLKVGQTINEIVVAKNGFNIADIEEFTKVLSRIGNVTSTTALQSIDTIITSGEIFGA